MKDAAEIVFRKPQADDLAIAVQALAAAGLPTADLKLSHLKLVATSGSHIAGLVGLEACSEHGLLRSLVVVPDYRGLGLGQRLVQALEETAKSDGIRCLWLLTIDAEGFFSTLGYERQDRSVAPAAIAASEEFSSLCPGSAAFMSKQLLR